MLRGPLYQSDYQPQLSGHETFPLRYGWLKKAFDAVQDTQKEDDTRQQICLLRFRCHRPFWRGQEYGRVDAPLGHCNRDH